MLLFFELFLFGFTRGVLGLSLHDKLSCGSDFLDGIFIKFSELVGDIVVAYNIVDNGLNINAIVMSLSEIVPLIYASDFGAVWENSCSIIEVNGSVKLNRLLIFLFSSLFLLNKGNMPGLRGFLSDLSKSALLVGLCLSLSLFHLSFEL